MPDPKASLAAAQAAGLATPQPSDFIHRGDDAITLNARFTTDALTEAAAAKADAATKADAADALKPTSDPETVFAVVDEAGRRTWLEIGPDGGPTTRALGLLRQALGLPEPTPPGPLATALANIAVSAFDVLHLGDSITEGANATAPGKRWVDILRDLGRAKHQPAGVAGGPTYVKGGHTYPGTQAYGWSLIGGATKEASNGNYIGSYNAYVDAAGEALSLTFTGTSITVYYSKFSVTGAPTLPVTLDGATVAGLGPYDGTDLAATRTYSGLTPGEHTLVISHPGNDTTRYRVHGAAVFNGDEAAGWRMWESALAGSTVPVSGLPNWERLFKKVLPDFVTIYYGTNEYVQNQDPATFETRLGGLVDMVKALPSAPVIALVQGYKPAHNGSTEVYAWPLYRDAVARVAAAKGTELVDLAPAFGGTGTPTAGLVDTDGVHPTDTGHATIADTIRTALDLY